MTEKILYTSARHDMVVAFQTVVGKNDKNQPILRKNVHFRDGSLEVEVTEENKGLIYDLDNHKLNIKNGGDVSRSFKRQDPSVNRIRKVAEGEVFCLMPAEGLQETDIELLSYLDRVAKALPEKARKNCAEKAGIVYDRFQFAGMPKPMEKNSIKILRSRIFEMLEALAVEKIWDGDGDKKTEGESDT